MDLLKFLKDSQDALSGWKTYASAFLAGLYWVGAGKGWWQRDVAIDAAAGIAIIMAMRAGSSTDSKKAVKAIKADTAKVVKAETAAVVEAQQTPTAPLP